MNRTPLLFAALLLTHCADESSRTTPANATPALNPARDYRPVGGEPSINDLARFLAGRPVDRGQALSAWQRTNGDYHTLAVEFDYLWRKMAAPRTGRQRDYARGTLKPLLGSASTVVYPFGGPDVLSVTAVFPDARTYVLVGLEKVGPVPDPMAGDPNDLVARLLDVMEEPLRYGYFITEDMRRAPEAAPILLCTLGVTESRVTSIKGISAAGRPGVEIRFRPPGGGSKRLIYVSADLSNSGFGPFRPWLDRYSGATVYFKAASYLPHDPSFSGIRNWVLSNARTVLQDDSGIPYAAYAAAGWNATLLGNYERPIPLFSEHRQPDLAAAYDAIPGANFIPFGSGYHVNRQDANLQVYRR